MSLRDDMIKRRDWFYETQLRRINMFSFRDLVIDDLPSPRLRFISEEQQAQAPLGSRPGPSVRVHLDSRKPVWTKHDKARRQALDNYLGRIGNWLDNRDPTRLVEKLKSLRTAYEASQLASELDTRDPLWDFPRARDMGFEGMGRAISRAEVAAAKPWLIPELYNDWDPNTLVPEYFVAGLERFVAGHEKEQLLADNAKAELVRRTWTVDGKAKYAYRPAIQTDGNSMVPVEKSELSASLHYWTSVFHHPLREVTALKPDSDMGLCQIVRILYRYGRLPDSFGTLDQLTWRKRTLPGAEFNEYFDERAKWIRHPDELTRMRVAQDKLAGILKTAFDNPRLAAPVFSPLAAQIVKHGVTSYKFWLDEPLRANENATLNQIRLALGVKDEDNKEMEYWSENHYIMFASSEYLLGQLWPDAEFVPGHAIYLPRRGAMNGARRRDRGKARVLKWLHNRIQFGWTEFNSSGYYREHLWALLNLVDFALDHEVREKAKIVTDLLLFDVVRFLHRGAMGAVGGRSQFKSKNCGWDNALADVIELMLGAHGIFSDDNSQIGASFATSSYVVPEVLLEIGASPPAGPATDRSRVSITFDEAPKHGIYTSMKTDARDSIWQGYQPKRDKHFDFRKRVDDAIALTHDNYGAAEDDMVFFWSMSAYFNKEIVVKSMEMVKAFGVQESDAFGKFRTVLRVLDYANRAVRGVIGGLIAGPIGAVVGALTPEIFGEDMDETVAGQMATFTDGSTRTRVNMLTYRTPDVMLSSAQNFRPGQLNFQSNVNQATLNTALSVFTTSGFAGLDISHLFAGLVGGPLAIGGNEGFVKGMELGDEGDGPGWWTGYWSLPMVAQAGPAAILIYDYDEIQEHLVETGSHVWFPNAGFDEMAQRRASAYDDANFPLFDFSAWRGKWLFGRVIHPVPKGSTGEPREAYIGVFSNQRPEWLDRGFELFERRVEEAKVQATKDGHPEPWTQPFPDYFAGRDWYVDRKNVWIMQIGSKAEFGSFGAFVDRVSSARIHLDDTGDLECTYDIPKQGGGHDRLSVAYGDRRIELNGAPLATDLYPRFENDFVRGGRVEWGQRAYRIEWNGKALLHDVSDFDRPRRTEDIWEQPDDAETIQALVMYLRTGDEEMEEFTVTTVTVHIGCDAVATDEVVAVGPVGEDTQHDAEWIFFVRPAKRSPDMSLTVHHTGSQWKASFTLKALMGDHRLRDCTLSRAGLHLEDERKTSPAMSFSVPLARWAQWEPIADTERARAWVIAEHPPAERGWQEFHDLVAFEQQGQWWHRRLVCGAGAWESLGRTDFLPASWTAVTDAYRQVGVFAVWNGRLHARWRTDGAGWDDRWTEIFTGAGAVTARPSEHPFGGVDLCVQGLDAGVHTFEAWRPGSIGGWDRTPVSRFTPVAGVGVQDVGGTLVALGTNGEVWRTVPLFGWRRLTPEGLRVRRFTADSAQRVACLSESGDVWVLTDGVWRVVAGPPVSPDSRLCWATPEPGRYRLFACAVDGAVLGVQLSDVPTWERIGTQQALPAAGLFATSRTRGQLEVFAVAEDLALTRAWWS